MTKIAVVGATGVYGRALVPLLTQAGHQVRALARSVEKAQKLFPQGVEIAACDLLAPDAAERLPALLAGCEAVAHIATAIPANASAPEAWVANTRLRTEAVRALLDAALQAGVGRYLQQSITMAYPDGGDEWIDEETPLKTSQTGSPVIQMEEMVKAIPTDRLHWSILRGGSFVGADTFQERLLEALRAGAAVVPGDGQNFISLIHVADMASATLAALEHAPAGSIFNIVDEPLRQGEYYDRLAAVLGVQKARRDESASRPPSWRCSNQRARSELGWAPTRGVLPEVK